MYKCLGLADLPSFSTIWQGAYRRKWQPTTGMLLVPADLTEDPASGKITMNTLIQFVMNVWCLTIC